MIVTMSDDNNFAANKKRIAKMIFIKCLHIQRVRPIKQQINLVEGLSDMILFEI